MENNSYKNIPTVKETDALMEELWAQFADVPMDPDTELMEDDFLHFPHGTSREEIWHWFDEHYSKGVAALLYGCDGVDRTADSAKMLYLSELCDECESRDCAYNHDGICRYAMVHEKAPKITEEDGCVSGVIDALGMSDDGEDDVEEGVKKATYVSVWDDGLIVSSDCKIELSTNRVFDIEEVDVDGLEILIDEYVLIDGVRYELTEGDNNDIFVVGHDFC